MKPLHINLDQHTHELLRRVRHTIVERNKERAANGQHTAFEGATFRDIVARGIDLVAAEVASPNDVI